ncbi:group I truncated hemoglobin [Brevundimonas sp.]
MIKTLALAAVSATLATTAAAQDPAHLPGEEAVAAYTVSNANAGTAPFEGEAMLQAFHGRDGIDRIVDGMLDRSIADPGIGEIFALTDMVRLRRTLKEQFCYILNGGCDYTGRDMVQSHADLGLQPADMGKLVEHLQAAMDQEGVPFHTQNRFLAKLAPMRRDVVTR